MTNYLTKVSPPPPQKKKTTTKNKQYTSAFKSLWIFENAIEKIRNSEHSDCEMLQ